MIVEYCVTQEIPCYSFWSGNKGIHIHIWLDCDIKNKEGIVIINKASKAGCNIWGQVRVKFAKEIVDQAGLSHSLIGQGKPIDLQKLYWDDMGGKFILIRACGGGNFKVNPDDENDVVKSFKTYLSELPTTKPKPNTFMDVKYPSKLTRYKLGESYPIEIAKSYLESVNTQQQRDVDFNYTGKWMNLPCIQRIMEGLPSGRRSYGSYLISLAARLDNVPVPQLKQYLEEYVKRCSQVPEKFDIQEADKWRRWVYKQSKPYWNCGNCVKIDMCFKDQCEYHKSRYKEEMKLFEATEPLQLIKKALDITVRGEEQAKMQLFLLYLTKEFNPEWCILIDGPASVGKTHVMKAVAELFGKEDEEYFVFSRMSSKVMNHIEEEAKKWSKKIVIIEELQGSKDVVEDLRIAISEGKLRPMTTIEGKNPDGTKTHVASKSVIIFDNLFVTCNAEEYDEGDQLLSRAWIITLDQTEDQTAKVMDYYLDEFSGEGYHKIDNLETIRMGLKLLERFDEIVFPFAEEVKGWLPAKTVRGRRDIKKLISLIKASAFFHQKQRYIIEKDKKILIADWRDVLVAFRYAGKALSASTHGLGQADVEDWDVIKLRLKQSQRDTFNLPDLCRWLNINKAQAYKKTSALVTTGLIENTTAAPLPALYEKTNLDISSMDINLYVDRCKLKIEDQDNLLKVWKKEYKNIPPKKGGK